MSWIQQKGSDVVVNLRVVPRSSRNAIDSILDDTLKVRLQTPPVDGKANKALIKFFGKFLSISHSRITLLAGDRSRFKRILIQGASEKDVRAVIARTLCSSG